ncbi:MAG: carboxymuconolactone decarboxylase family protein [Chloroflexi bacterium]|nr:carboxymuconolactone decarboxylase family protein [Chloroflexota bacterium]
MARLPYISRNDLPPDKRPIYDHIAKTRQSVDSTGSPQVEPFPEAPNSFRLLLNSPDAAEAVGRVGEYLRLQSPLDPVAREIAILATAKALNSTYEWTHHEPIARRVGVRDEVIQSIKSGRAPMGLPAKEGVFAQAAKELVTKGTLTERTFQAINHLLGPQQTVDLLVLIGYYAMLGTVLSALGAELEPGWEPISPE